MKDQERSRYPIGNFTYGRPQSAKEVQRNIRVLERFPKELRRLLDRLRPQEYDLPYRQGGWTVRQVVHHMADSHMNAYIRMKLAYTEVGPRIKPYEEALWAETEDARTGPLKPSLQILRGLHRRWTAFLDSLNDEDFDRGYYHPELHGTLELSEAIAMYAWHCQHHLAHIRLVVDAVDGGPAVQQGKRRGRRPAAALSNGAARQNGQKADDGKPRRKRRTKDEMERDRAAAAAARQEGGEPKRRGLSPERMAEVRAIRMANIAARKAAQPQPAVAPEAPKRKRRTKDEMERDRAAAAAARQEGGEPKRRGLSPERMAEVRAIRMANIAARKAAQGQRSAEPEAPKRKRRSKDEMARLRAEQAAAGGEKKRRGLSPERMAEVRAIRMANIAAKKAALQPATTQDAAPAEARRRGRPKAERPAAAEVAERPKRAGRSAEHMARIREIRMANVAAKKAGQAAPPAPAEKPAVDGEKKRRGASPEQLEAMRRSRETKRNARNNGAATPPVPVERTEPKGEQPPAAGKRTRKPNANAHPVDVADPANPGMEVTAKAPREKRGGSSGRGSKAKSGDETNTTGPATKTSKKKNKG
jgi:hypothetical protein